MSRQREQKLAAIYDAFDANNYKVSVTITISVRQCMLEHLQALLQHMSPELCTR